MAVREILLLGDPRLYQTAVPVAPTELARAARVVGDLRDTMLAFRAKYGFGRAIAAPQIGELLRIIYLNLGDSEFAFLNPCLSLGGGDFELWDDCMSFPGLEVRLRRSRRAAISYRDLDWQEGRREFTGDLAELIQHEYDHLDGILAVQRAIDDKSLRINVQKTGCF